MLCTEHAQHEFEAIIFMATWHHSEWNRNPWSSSERFCEKQQWLVFSYRSVGKKQEQIIFWSQHLLHYWKLNYAREGGKGHDKVFSFSLFYQKFSLRSCLSHQSQPFFSLFWLENDQKLNCDEAYNFENNINFTLRKKFAFLEFGGVRFHCWILR